ncbi:MAG: hypothetical protein LQ352_005681 [Teloschistes flavicans]|nr:MAG: hypothetical protein LQ352_005681 [Teloschistes flavicans]
MGSTTSDKSSSTTFTAPSSHPSQSSRGSSPPRKPLPASAKLHPLLTSRSNQELHTREAPQIPPLIGPTLSPPLTADDDEFDAPFDVLKPLPQRLGSPVGSSTSFGGSRPGSRPASPSKTLLRPSTPTSDTSRPTSRAGSRPGSRASSPQKHFHRPFTPTSDTSRPASRGNFGPGSRPESPSKQWLASATSQEPKSAKRRSWLPGKSRPEAQHGDVQLPQAWIIAPSTAQKHPYDLSSLVNFQTVGEIWNESGDTIVYLHAKDAYRGPSFRVFSSAFAASKKLSLMAYANTKGGISSERNSDERVLEERTENMTLQPPDSRSRPGSPIDTNSQGSRSFSNTFDDARAQSISLYVPLPLQADLTSAGSNLSSDDIEHLIAVRNVFAFLTKQPLVATSRTPTIFDIFLKIADFLQRYEFSNLDGSTLGEEAATSFEEYISFFTLSDVRSSREKTMEAIILGERMRSWGLYNEGFVHGVGKYDQIASMKSPRFHMITDATAKRLERATLDLSLRLKTVRTRLGSFDFPSLFSGIANSTTSTESKTVRFKAWKSSFLAMRRHVLAFYKERYGAWPPKAESKKNEFEESGLNRILLQEVYRDFSDLYDALVNRDAITTRSSTSPPDSSDDDEITASALRRVMDEYDRSSPPVQPAVPFDIPLLPTLTGSRRGFESLDVRRQKKENSKRLANDEINLALMQSYNRDSINSTPFLQAFMELERQSAKGKSIEEMQELRNGQWLFMYAVIQSLPLVVVDAPGLQWTKGVEYFLCEVPKGNAPWTTETHSRGWYAIAGSAGLVSLPADIIDHGVDGIYRRSHCWQVAEKLTGSNDLRAIPSTEFNDEVLVPPPVLSPGNGPSSRSSSPSRYNQRHSVQLGLEALPLPAGVAPAGAKPVITRHDPSKSFEDILGEAGVSRSKKR